MANQRTNYWIIILTLMVLVYLLYSLLLDNPLTIPEAGYCLEKNYETDYTTINHANGTKTPVEYCPLKTFCETYEEDTIVKDNGETFDEQKLNDFQTTQENKGLQCFQDVAYHTQRETNIFKTSTEILTSKFVCCTTNNLESSGCPGNTCEGRYMGFLDNNGCRIYAVEIGYNEEGLMKITTCGGNPLDINYELESLELIIN